MVKCVKCGMELPDDSDFCSKCGERIIKIKTEPVAEPFYKSTESITPKTNMVSKSIYDDNVVEPEERRIPKKVLIGGIAAVCAVVIVITAYFNISKNKYVTTDSSSTTEHTKEEISEAIKTYDNYMPSHITTRKLINTEYNFKENSPEEKFFNRYYHYGVSNYVYFLDDDFSDFVVVTMKLPWVNSGDFAGNDFVDAFESAILYQETAEEYGLNRQVLIVCYDVKGDMAYTLTSDGWLFDTDGNNIATLSWSD